MPTCKFCNKPVITARAMHSACWERECDKMAKTFCDEYCRWPRECADEDALETHCNACALVTLFNLGL